MQDNPNLSTSLGELYEHSRQYLEDNLEYAKLTTSKKIAVTMSALITMGLVMILGLLVVLFLMIALGFHLATIWGSNALAFLAIAGILTLIGGIIFAFKRQIITNPLLKIILNSLLD